jgi:hephaestin
MVRRFVGTLLSMVLVGGVAFAVARNTASPTEVAAAAILAPPQTRTYYVAADEVAWDFAPLGKNMITGQPFDDTANVYVKPAPDRIGHIYKKAQYREYTDTTFTALKPVPAAWQHLGILGPTLHAEVGDTIKFVFKNNTTRPLSVHPHGVRYTKANEGAPYNDGSPPSAQGDDAVPPGNLYTYTWEVPDRAGPGPMDPSSVMWMYHSHTDEVGDDYAGLLGAMVVTRKGFARPDGTPRDVDREFVDVFQVLNENSSPYLDANIAKYAGNPALVNKADPDFQESNKKHTINGYVFGNQPMQTARLGEHVRWYLMGMGTEVDLHTPHWHGNTVMINGMRTDVTELLPASMRVADMVLDNPGTWLFHCHVNDHITAGMLTRFQVLP